MQTGLNRCTRPGAMEVHSAVPLVCAKARKASIALLIWALGWACMGSTAYAQGDDLSAKAERLYREGRYADAIPIVLQLVKKVEALHGPDHPDTANGLRHRQ